jgi:hypothetical protein
MPCRRSHKPAPSPIRPPGKHGAFLGPKDAYFAVLPAASSTLSFYLTATFRGKTPAAFTVELSTPAASGPGLLAGPAALGAPREGAEAAAREEERKKREKERKEREEKEREENGEGSEGEREGGGEGEKEKSAEPEKPEALRKAERRLAEASSDEEVRAGWAGP